METYPCFIDFEASTLANGTYPIEVAWSVSDGTVHEHLIRPETLWTSWDKRAEEVHGISRDEIIAHGKSTTEVSSILCDDLMGCEVYADGGLLDYEWLCQLLQAGGHQKPSFRLLDCCPELFFPSMPHDLQRDLRNAAWEVVGQRHRAGNDVRWLITWLRLGREAGYQEDVLGSASRAKGLSTT